jgi:hypothetical protein
LFISNPAFFFGFNFLIVIHDNFTIPNYLDFVLDLNTNSPSET